jgi:hypothetical protein
MGPPVASFLLRVLLLAGVAVVGILTMDRSHAAVGRIYDNELLARTLANEGG